VEDRPDHAAGAGLEDELKGLRPEQEPDLAQSRHMKRFSENGARPVRALGGLNTPPFGRLGALVFQPHNSDTLYWASLRAWTRIVGCALGFRPGDTGWENVYPEKRLARGLDGSGPRSPRALSRSERLRRQTTISFSLWTVVAQHTRETPGRSPSHSRERMHPQSTGGPSAQVALLQSPILSAAGADYRTDRTQARPSTKTTMT
jgi:hypothetical protein